MLGLQKLLNDHQIFELLSPSVQKWVASQNWASFRDIQKQSISLMLSENAPQNIVISASTSGGKTESAFLPALSLIEKQLARNTDNYVRMIYVAPLKALINDQHRRLSKMAENIGIQVCCWHGDSSVSEKKRMLKEHNGIIMITPESLSSFLINRGSWCSKYMTPDIIVIDEFHAFLGNSRGKQLLSLLSRIDILNKVAEKLPAQRIALSATLSNLETVGNTLSPEYGAEIIDGTQTSKKDAIINVKSFLPPVQHQGQKRVKDDMHAIANEIIQESQNEKTLSFAKSRMQVENIAATINEICNEKHIDSQAFPHHGSLSKEIRESLEHRLVTTDKPTMAVATMTLELGIDIGDIYQVFQVGTTSSVSSLRQRVGRSGRRDGQRRFECLVTTDRQPTFETELLTTIAEIEMMEQGWFEPFDDSRKDISVLISECLSVLAQYESAYIEELENVLITNGAFKNISHELFVMVINDMLDANYIEYISKDKLLSLGAAGEQEINDYRFYATFTTEDAYTVKSGQKVIGELMPPKTALNKLFNNGIFMLGGKYWQVVSFDMKSKLIEAKQVNYKTDFLIQSSRRSGDVVGKVKQFVLDLLTKHTDYYPEYLDELSKQKLENARIYAQEHHLNKLGVSLKDQGEKGHESPQELLNRLKAGYTENSEVSVNPPVNESALNAIEKALESSGMEQNGLENIFLWRLAELTDSILNNWDEIEQSYTEMFFDSTMVEDIKTTEKYNHICSSETITLAYAEELFDLEGAKRWFEAFKRFYNSGEVKPQ